MNKTIKNIIIESLSNTAITRDEAINDYKIIHDGAELVEKKAIAAKYGIDSKKGKEIEHGILLYIRDLRNNQTSFDAEDVKYFNRLDEYDTYKKESEFFAMESEEFLKYLLDFRLAQVKENKLESYIGWTSSELKWRVSMRGAYLLSQYANIKRYFDEHSNEYTEKVNETNIIYEKLLDEMKDFKESYIKSVEGQATNFYKALPRLKDEAIKKYEELYQEYAIWEKENRNATWGARNAHSKEYKKEYNKYISYRNTLDKFTLESYVEDQVEKAERTFNEDTMAVAERVNEKHLNVSNLTVSQVGWDAKYFEMMISDGEKKLYARSVLAAANSIYMVPHFRFIITDRSRF